MKLLTLRAIIMAFLLSLLGGCASTRNVELANDFWNKPNQKIAIVTAQAPVPQLYEEGQQGLLDMAINTAANSGINNSLKSTDLNWYYSLPQKFESRLQKRHFDVVNENVTEKITSRDYKKIASRLDADLLLVIRLQAVGAKRNYVSFIPTEAPQAYCAIEGELIDINNNNKVLWRYQTHLEHPVAGEWKQPPQYPNLRTAIDKATKVVQKEMVDSFFSTN